MKDMGSRKLLLGMYQFLPVKETTLVFGLILCLLDPSRDGFVVTRKELSSFPAHCLTGWDESKGMEIHGSWQGPRHSSTTELSKNSLYEGGRVPRGSLA